ncbi:MAG: DUF481 domain-containing protein [Planctomycetota bacterium]
MARCLGHAVLTRVLPLAAAAAVMAPAAAWSQPGGVPPYPSTGYGAPPPLLAPAPPPPMPETGVLPRPPTVLPPATGQPFYAPGPAPAQPASSPPPAAPPAVVGSPPLPGSPPPLGSPPLPAPVEVLPPPGSAPPVEAAPPIAPLAAPAAPVGATPTVVEDAAAAEGVAEAIEEEPPARWYQPIYWFGPAPWDSGFELGINGSTGTSDTLSIRTGGYIKRETDRNKVDLSLYYNKTTANGEETQNNAILKARNDRDIGQLPWSVFLMTQVFYDEFQAFDLNVNVNSGLGFKVFDEEWVKLRTSIGAGASREFGGAADRWVPEAQFGLDWEQQISPTQKFYAGVDYFPEFEDFGSFRVVSDMGLEIELSRPSNVSLKLSATDRYDSSPDGVRPHITNYSVLLLWKR